MKTDTIINLLFAIIAITIIVGSFWIFLSVYDTQQDADKFCEEQGGIKNSIYAGCYIIENGVFVKYKVINLNGEWGLVRE